MIGCLVMVGKGKMSVHQVKECLDAKDRSKAPGMAPAHGLYLANVEHGSFLI
jgi:tRNA pseudouridine38-40 synthase